MRLCFCFMSLLQCALRGGEKVYKKKMKRKTQHPRPKYKAEEENRRFDSCDQPLRSIETEKNERFSLLMNLQNSFFD